jgi:predicted GNAT family acetyltransferase
METRVVDDPEEERFELIVDGRPAGLAEYRLVDSVIAFTHTEIDPAFEGQGLGSILARAALDAAREEKLAVLPYCPFIKGWIAKHSDYVNLVPEHKRAQFGLQH